MVKLFFTGDIFIRNATSSILSPALRDFLGGFNVVSCNFEGVVGRESPTLKPSVKVGPLLAQSPSSVQTLKDDGFNLFCLANNHIWDYGLEGLTFTVATVGKDGVVGAGTSFSDAYEGKTYEFDGMKVGILAFCEYGFGAFDTPEKGGGYAWINSPVADEMVQKMRSKVDFLVVQVHAGVEGMELPLPEWAERYRSFVRLGVDMVIGHHPHRVQPVEKYGSGIICYSLGNFYFDYAAHSGEEGRRSLGIALTLREKGELFSYEKIFLQQIEDKVFLADDPKRASRFEDLCRAHSSSEYSSIIDREALRLWKDVYKRLYALAVPSFGLWGFLKNCARRVLGKAPLNKNVLLFHNISIESHRWIVQRALNVLEHIS